MTPDDVHKLGYTQLKKLYPLVSKIEEYLTGGSCASISETVKNPLSGQFSSLDPLLLFRKSTTQKSFHIGLDVRTILARTTWTNSREGKPDLV